MNRLVAFFGGVFVLLGAGSLAFALLPWLQVGNFSWTFVACGVLFSTKGAFNLLHAYRVHRNQFVSTFEWRMAGVGYLLAALLFLAAGASGEGWWLFAVAIPFLGFAAVRFLVARRVSVESRSSSPPASRKPREP